MIGCKAGIAISKQKILVRKTKQDDAQEKVWYLGYSVCIVCQSKTDVFRTLLWKFVANLNAVCPYYFSRICWIILFSRCQNKLISKFRLRFDPAVDHQRWMISMAKKKGRSYFLQSASASENAYFKIYEIFRDYSIPFTLYDVE